MLKLTGGLGATGTFGLGSIDAAVATQEQEGDRNEVEEVISDWPEKQRTEAQRTMDEYGVPEGVTERRLIWYGADPWKRIEMFRDATPHDFPAPHPDFFEQVVDYGVPSTMADDLTEYDGSVMFERTTGELSARCHTEWANVLAINLAHDVLSGEETVKTARETYAENAERKMAGESPAYTEALQFEPPAYKQPDPDVTIIDSEESRNG